MFTEPLGGQCQGFVDDVDGVGSGTALGSGDGNVGGAAADLDEALS